MVTASRLVLMLVLCLGILLPKVSAAITLALPGLFRTIVICTGDSLQTITLGPDGSPVEMSQGDDQHCTLMADPADQRPADGFWQALARSHRVLLPAALPTLPDWRHAHSMPTRAPPVLTV